MKKKKKAKLTGFAGLSFIISAAAYIASSSYLKSYNLQLEKEMRMLEDRIAYLQKYNTSVYYQVTELSDYERMRTLSEDTGVNPHIYSMIAITPEKSD